MSFFFSPLFFFFYYSIFRTHCILHSENKQSGIGVYTSADRYTIKGNYIDGVLQGPVEERGPSGNLVFQGTYQDSMRSGYGELHLDDGGMYCGNFTEGVLDDKCARYYYSPHNSRCLFGEWSEGEMVKSWFCDIPRSLRASSLQDKGVTMLSPSNKIVYSFDESTDKVASKNPKLSDPYEEELVYVKDSLIPGANEGLFAKVDLPAGIVCSMYGGIRITQTEVDQRDWALNANTITLIEDTDTTGTVIDVPPELNDTNEYCATLGHKANHSFTSNSKYDVFDHPRFGFIKCIRTLEPVAAGEEVTVYYGYDEADIDEEDGVPEWYRLAFSAYHSSK